MPGPQTKHLEQTQVKIFMLLKKMFIINEVKFPLWNGMIKQQTNSEFVFIIKIYF